MFVLDVLHLLVLCRTLIVNAIVWIVFALFFEFSDLDLHHTPEHCIPWTIW